MDRREALKAFLALPAMATITRAEVKPTDVLVIEYEGAISEQTAASLTAKIRDIFGPDQRVAVLGDGMKLRVISA